MWWVDPGWMPGAHQATLPPPFTAEQGTENIMKGSWVEIRTGRDHSPVTITAKTDST